MIAVDLRMGLTAQNIGLIAGWLAIGWVLVQGLALAVSTWRHRARREREYVVRRTEPTWEGEQRELGIAPAPGVGTPGYVTSPLRGCLNYPCWKTISSQQSLCRTVLLSLPFSCSRYYETGKIPVIFDSTGLL